MTADERATEVMRCHYGFDPLPADWQKSELAFLIATAIRDAVLEEREACAKICDPAARPPSIDSDVTEWQTGWNEGYSDAARAIAYAIRARNNS
jgi:hypothetical protein